VIHQSMTANKTALLKKSPFEPGIATINQ